MTAWNYEVGDVGANVSPLFDFRNGIPVLDFGPSVSTKSEFSFVVPHHYDSGGGTITIGWMASTATSGDVSWLVDFIRVTDDATDLDTANFVNVGSVIATAPNISGEVDYAAVPSASTAFMSPDIEVGDYIRVRVRRGGSAGADTMSGDAELLFVEIKED